jgi:hypothetical protein
MPPSEIIDTCRGCNVCAKLSGARDKAYPLTFATNASVRPEGRQGKFFFSEEKKQKTFTSPPLPRSRPWPVGFRSAQNKSLLVLFFRKEHTCLTFLPNPSIIVQRGINATVRFSKPGRFPFLSHFAPACGPADRCSAPQGPGTTGYPHPS